MPWSKGIFISILRKVRARVDELAVCCGGLAGVAPELNGIVLLHGADVNNPNWESQLEIAGKSGPLNGRKFSLHTSRASRHQHRRRVRTGFAARGDGGSGHTALRAHALAARETCCDSLA
jgi:hypothetical protein